MTEELNPIRIIRHKANDMSLTDDGLRKLWSAQQYLDGQLWEEKVNRWKEGRL